MPPWVFPLKTVNTLNLLGISGISNLLSAIKTARYFEMTSDDIIVTIATDSAEMYLSRLEELSNERVLTPRFRQLRITRNACLAYQPTGLKS